MLALTYCISLLGGGGSKIGGQTWVMLGHVGSFFALGRLFFALGRFLCTFWALLAHLGRFFRFFGFGFYCFRVVSGRLGDPGGVKTAPRDLFGGVLTNFHPDRMAGDPKMSKILTELTSINF